jgi:hypothetical protein
VRCFCRAFPVIQNISIFCTDYVQKCTVRLSRRQKVQKYEQRIYQKLIFEILERNKIPRSNDPYTVQTNDLLAEDALIRPHHHCTATWTAVDGGDKQ